MYVVYALFNGDICNTKCSLDSAARSIQQPNKNGSKCATGSTCAASLPMLLTGIMAAFMATMAFWSSEYKVCHYYDVILYLMIVVGCFNAVVCHGANIEIAKSLPNHNRLTSYNMSVFVLVSMLIPFTTGEYLIETIESPHPYKNSQQLSGTFAMTPGSVTSTGNPSCLRVIIDPRSATETGNDYFGITGPGDRNTVLSLDGSFGQVKEHQHFDVLRASAVAWSFSSDSGVTEWGYKVSVMPCNQCPIGHAKTTTSLASIIDVDRHCKLCVVGFYDPGGTIGSW